MIRPPVDPFAEPCYHIVCSWSQSRKLPCQAVLWAIAGYSVFKQAESRPFMTNAQVMILGVGNILFSDEGFGIRVVEELQQRYAFPDNVTIVDGGVLGVSLMGVMAEADHLIVVDVIRNQGVPGDLYRLAGDAIPERIRAKNSLHQIDFLEALTLCQALDKVPEAVIVGVEPEDINTLSTELTATTKDKIDDIIRMVLDELDRLGIRCARREES